MNRVIFILLGTLAISLALPKNFSTSHIENLQQFKEWQHQYGVHYKTPQEEIERLKVFSENLIIIEQLNSENDGAVYGTTRFADLTFEEFKNTYLRQRVPENLAKTDRLTPSLNALKDVPTSWDWRNYGAVTSVKNQGQCGSCWSFSAVANIEGQYYLNHKDTLSAAISFSEQQLVDCDTVDLGCNGGWMDDAFEWIEDNGGIETYAAYPYTGVGGTCKFNSSLAVAQVTGYTDLSTNETELAAQLYEIGPLSAAVNANRNWQLYTGGILNPKSCDPEKLDHGITIVGYGNGTSSSGSNENYWIIKNSWDTTWGIQGYVYLNRGNGTCGVNTAASTSSVA